LIVVMHLDTPGIESCRKLLVSSLTSLLLVQRLDIFFYFCFSALCRLRFKRRLIIWTETRWRMTTGVRTAS
jgi:hypothetical protein